MGAVVYIAIIELYTSLPCYQHDVGCDRVRVYVNMLPRAAGWLICIDSELIVE